MTRTLTAALALLLATAAFAADEPLAIQDNSFLIEEAYNQENRVVQHIFTFQRERDGSFVSTFTQEWPALGQKHQLSYTIPLQRFAPTGRRGVGDTLVNYRYQLVGSGETLLAVSPRLSLIVPTGDEKLGFGSGGYGFDANLPVSLVVAPRVVTHWNAGVTKTPSSLDATTYTAGASVIWAAMDKVHFMLENRWSRSERSTFVVSPGIRWAHDFKSGLQVVPGIAMPIDTRTHERSAFLYLSLEHPF